MIVNEPVGAICNICGRGCPNDLDDQESRDDAVKEINLDVLPDGDRLCPMCIAQRMEDGVSRTLGSDRINDRRGVYGAAW